MQMTCIFTKQASSHEYSILLPLILQILSRSIQRRQEVICCPKNARSNISIRLNSMSLKATNQNQNVGVIIDADVNLFLLPPESSANSGFSVSTRHRKTCLWFFFFSSRLGYCNSVFISLRWLLLSQRIDFKP